MFVLFKAEKIIKVMYCIEYERIVQNMKENN